jgi:hypothetical protein
VRWRLALNITAAIEIAARAAIAIRIGTSGDEPPLSSWEALGGAVGAWPD